MLMEEDVRDTLLGLSTRIGRRRAGQGLALDSLLRAVRMDFRFLWEALVDHLAGEDPAGLSGDVIKIREVVEIHTSRVQAAYLDELAHIRRAAELEHGYLLRRLLVDGAEDARQLEQLASALGLPVHGRFVLAAASGSYSKEFRDAVVELGWSVPVYTVDGFEVAIFHERIDGEESRNRLLTLPAGLAPSDTGLNELASVWELAQRLAECVSGPAMAAVLVEHWESIVGRDIAPGLAAFRDQILGGFDQLTPTARQLTLRTVQEYFRTGSVSVTSATLYCHRNTVLKRLRQFTECTGLDPSRPNDAGTIRLVLSGAGTRT
jgi:DNA-binding PucR family transcriptional regulator